MQNDLGVFEEFLELTLSKNHIEESLESVPLTLRTPFSWVLLT